MPEREKIALSCLVEVNPRDLPVGGEIPYVAMEDVSEDGELLRIGRRSRRSLAAGQPTFRDGDVLFAKITPCMENGKGAFVSGLGGGIAQGSTEFHVLRARRGVADPRFIYQWIRTPQIRLAAAAMMTGSAGQRRVPTDFFDKFEIPVLRLAEQRRIVEILDSLDEVIVRQNRVISQLCHLADGLSESLLSPLTRRRSVPVADIFEIRAGITLSPYRAPRSHRRNYLRVANVQRGFLDLSDVAQMECSVMEESVYGLAEGDLLVVEGHANPGEIGRCAMVDSSAIGMLYQNHLFRLRSDYVVHKFGEAWLNSPVVRNYWNRMCATSSGLYTINSKALARLPFPDLSVEEQSRLCGVLVSIEGRVKREKAYMKRLKLIKSGLMEDLLSGRVRVPEAEALVENL